MCDCLICPNCGTHEVDHDWEPITEEDKKKYIFGCRFNLRTFKIDDWSACEICKCWFDTKGNLEHYENSRTIGLKHQIAKTQGLLLKLLQ